MSAGKGVVFTFKGRREWTNTPQFSVGIELFATSSKNFMAIGLMSYIPYDSVLWGVVDIV